jgi:hypothetical protein
MDLRVLTEHINVALCYFPFQGVTEAIYSMFVDNPTMNEFYQVTSRLFTGYDGINYFSITFALLFDK